MADNMMQCRILNSRLHILAGFQSAHRLEKKAGVLFSRISLSMILFRIVDPKGQDLFFAIFKYFF